MKIRIASIGYEQCDTIKEEKGKILYFLFCISFVLRYGTPWYFVIVRQRLLSLSYMLYVQSYLYQVFLSLYLGFCEITPFLSEIFVTFFMHCVPLYSIYVCIWNISIQLKLFKICQIYVSLLLRCCGPLDVCISEGRSRNNFYAN